MKVKNDHRSKFFIFSFVCRKNIEIIFISDASHIPSFSEWGLGQFWVGFYYAFIWAATGLGLAVAREHHSSNLIESLIRNHRYWSGANFLIWAVPWPNMFLEWGWLPDSVASRSAITSLSIVNFTGQVWLSFHLSLSPGFCEFCKWTFFIMSFPCCMIMCRWIQQQLLC